MNSAIKHKGLLWGVALSVGALIEAASATLPAQTGPGVVSIRLPQETALFKPAPGAELAQGHCLTCHSADYVYMQPPLAQDKWKAVVEKMRKVFGCAVPDADVETLARYLALQNGPQHSDP
jgi:mono/diheme cytochrome c family protein